MTGLVFSLTMLLVLGYGPTLFDEARREVVRRMNHYRH